MNGPVTEALLHAASIGKGRRKYKRATSRPTWTWRVTNTANKIYREGNDYWEDEAKRVAENARIALAHSYDLSAEYIIATVEGPRGGKQHYSRGPGKLPYRWKKT